MMETTDSKSKECGYESCSRAAESNGLCIFHIRKPTLEEKQQMSADDRRAAEETERYFRERFFALLEDLANDSQIDKYNFQGFSFPSINLKGTKYSKPVDFSYATFSEWALFVSGTFSGEADFSRVTFGRETTFSPGPSKPLFKHECYFQGLKVQKDAYVEFHDVDLSKASFLNTNLENIGFSDVKWYELSRSVFRRNVALWDELRGGVYLSKSEYEQLAENYRQLVLNYDRKRDYVMAEQFHVGEMEVLRKKTGAEATWPLIGWLRRWLNGYAIYRLLSHYGTSYWHAGLMLVVLLVCFSWIFLFTGFQPASEESPVAKMTEENPKPEVIEYDWGGSTPVSQWIADYWKSVLLTLSIMTFQRERSYKPEGDLSEVWFVIATIILAAQVALVLLAIRRRFKR